MEINLLLILKEKAEIFNSFFTKRCSLISSSSSKLPSALTRKTNELLSSIDFSKKDIMHIAQNQDPSKTHRHHA